MPGKVGSLLILSAFIIGILTLVGYALYSKKTERRFLIISNWLFGLKGILLLVAGGILLYLIITHQFNYYYVYNYTSSDLNLKYLVSAFWGGQEGSFLIWILFSELIGLGLMKWVHEPYKGPVLFFLTLNQLFLISMILGLDLAFLKLGASPFRSLAEAFPNAPFLVANPDFVPADGKGLNDLLKSPWMVIHPPILFLGFSLMTVPFCFAMAALWKGEFRNWINHALPWTLGANLALFTAVFLGGYWAYVTLSFGGYWAWDPVENASIIPFFIGIAAVHTMVIQRKPSSGGKASIILAILAYSAVIYESFLTRSGVLGSSSVHSFTDLGLYNQLLVFMIVILLVSTGFIMYRYKELPIQQRESKILSREFWTFSGSMILFLIAIVILIGTSSPILGQIFIENPTPPEIDFYNNWTMPLAMLTAILTVIGQYLFWKKHTLDSLAGELLLPLAASSCLTLLLVFIGAIESFYYILYLFSAVFALLGNAFILVRLVRQNFRILGGTISHIGFAVMLIGFLASSSFQKNLLDSSTRTYNEAIKAGKVIDENGFPLQQTLQYVELKKNQPKIVNEKYRINYLGHILSDQARPGQHAYKIQIEKISGGQVERSSYMYPEVYPMSSGTDINWSVDVDVKAGFLSDVYMYVAGSSYVEQKNRQHQAKLKNPHIQVSEMTEVESSDDWILLMAEEKPFVSLVWSGIFLLMLGFSFSILRHRKRLQNIL